MAHDAGIYLQLFNYEATRSFSTSPGWDASPSQGYPVVDPDLELRGGGGGGS